MIVTGLFFADSVSALGGALGVLGGVWDGVRDHRVGTGEPYDLIAVAIVQRSQEDPQRGKVTIAGHLPDGTKVVESEIEMNFGSRENSFIWLRLPTPLPVEGRYRFTAAADGGEPTVAVRLDVQATKQD